jgi:hypothetical protein
MKMEWLYVMHLDLDRCPAPLAGGLFGQVLFFHLVPLRASKMRAFALDDVLNIFEVPLH